MFYLYIDLLYATKEKTSGLLERPFLVKQYPDALEIMVSAVGIR
jgi:hypothetical protein